MKFFLTALDQQAGPREFNCELPLLEQGFDFLSSLVAQGNTLLSVYVVEDDHRMDLPLDAFDGFPFSLAIKTLQQEWQTLLSHPIPFDLIHKQELIVLTRQRIGQYQTILAIHESMIQHCTGWLERSKRSNVQSGELLRHHYRQMIITNQHQLAKAQFRSQLVTSRLSQLMA